ncbi:PAS domain-containing protein [Sulfurovum sp. bin170]|uniref:PAS domain-containing protein n=1 Tax=Sulfurovum sp. bin170 TaxID=2695268 RepID=UPI0013E0628B|nr:PAS domain-containing protein [Sulfurovum sp. bin170]NEW60347.1 PAS domain-containing protein [Sulfurovum sp. bin170]
MRFYRPLPRDEEINISSKKIIVSKTDISGRILYVNDYFCTVSGYEASEVVGAPHSILRHPDMPRAIFYLMWQSIQNGDNVTAIVKNLAKSGKYYWVTTDFEIHRDDMGRIESYIAFRRAAAAKAIEAVEELYAQLLLIEKKHGMLASLVYLKGYLNERDTTYSEFMDGLVKPKSLMEKLFSLMKNRFYHTSSSNNNNYSDRDREVA